MVEDEDDDGFAFPTTVPGPAAPGGASSSRLWPFAAPLVGETTTAGVKEGEVEAVDDDEDRMDLLWEGDTAAEGKTIVRAEPEPRPAAARPAQADDERAKAVAEQERMDLLWESFNEELLLLRQRQRRAGSNKSTAGDGTHLHGPDPDWYLCPSSDADESEVSSPGRARHGGCAPAMLRASSRAGGAGQLCGSPRRRGRSGAGGWALLLRLFRRLFSAGDRAPPRRRQSFYVP